MAVTHKAKRNDPCCFTAGTLVHTKVGLKPIENIRVDDWILSYPDDQVPPRVMRRPEDYAYRQVVRVYVREQQSVSKLVIDHLATNEKETYLVTKEHPIYCDGKGWVPVSKIQSTD